MQKIVSVLRVRLWSRLFSRNRKNNIFITFTRLITTKHWPACWLLGEGSERKPLRRHRLLVLEIIHHIDSSAMTRNLSTCLCENWNVFLEAFQHFHELQNWPSSYAHPPLVSFSWLDTMTWFIETYGDSSIWQAAMPEHQVTGYKHAEGWVTLTWV